MLARFRNTSSSFSPALRVAAFSSNDLSRFHDLLQDIHNTADSKKKLSVQKLTTLFRLVNSREDLIEATKALRVYELNFIDPVQKTAGEFVKCSIAQNSGDLALKVFRQHHRIGLFVSPGTLNQLLLYFYKKHDYVSAITLFKEMKMYKVIPNAETYDFVLRSLLGQEDFNSLIDILKTAGEANKVKVNTINHLIIQLKKHDNVEIVAKLTEIIHQQNLPQNDITNKEEGYFTSENREVLHAPKVPMDFNDFWGKYEYKHALTKLYEMDKEAWMTPVEVFYPYYSNAIANYMLMAPFTNDTLNIFEIGGGAGTNAKCILDYIQVQAPALYEKTTYTLIEISPRMAARQRERVKDHPMAKVVNSDILTYSKHFPKFTESCYFIAMEVLDNLPHDKVTQYKGQWYETWVNKSTMTEELKTLSDPLIQQTLDHFPSELPLREHFKPSSRVLRKAFGMPEKLLHSAFVPTGAMQLLNTLKTSFPKHHLIAADFDTLPSPTFDGNAVHKVLHHSRSPTSTASGSLHAAYAPLVASKTSGVTVDHDTYLIQGGIADIFFPTDFIKLKNAYCQALERQSHEVSIVKSSAFLEQFAEVEKTKTILGYNPLLQDYENTSFILS